MKRRVVVLGAGRIGALVARDLADGFSVTVLDADPGALARLADAGGLETRVADLAGPGAVRTAVEPFDLVVGALPGAMGYAALREIVEAGRSVVDISFMPEDPRDLDAEARRRGVVAIVDCGVAPGVTNMLVGRAAARLEALEKVRILVGGVPRVRVRPFEYKAGFSPADVLEEYTRPARVVVGGRVVAKEPLSEVETFVRPEVGTVEAFLSDGLRTLMDTCPAPWMEEKTIRYPGHAELMRTLRDAGFLGTEPVDVGGVTVAPRDLTARLLFPLWAFAEGEEDLTLMRVEIEGREDGRRVRIVHDLSDAYDRETGRTSMARTTAFPCAAALRLVASGAIDEPGVHPPEIPARRPGVWEAIASDLEARGVQVTELVETLGRG